MRYKMRFHVATLFAVLIINMVTAFLSAWTWCAPLMFIVMVGFMTIQGFYGPLKYYIPMFAIIMTVLFVKREFAISDLIMPEFFFFMILRLLPTIMSAHCIMKKQPGEIASFLQKAKLSNNVSLMLTVAFRFAPSVGSEVSSIKDNMKNRGMLSTSSVVRHPARTVEYAFVPLMMRSLDIADDLTLSAMTRGVEAPCRRYSYFDIKFRVQDALCILCFVIMTGSLLYYGGLSI